MITDSIIALGDQLGAQMSTYANLYYIAKENNQELVLFNAFKKFRRGYQFLDVFNKDNFKLIGKESKFINFYNNLFNKTTDWKYNFNRIYGSRLLNKFDALIRRMYLINKGFIRVDYLKNDVHANEYLLNLDNEKNYDIHNGLGTYQDWKKYREEITNVFSFNDEIKSEGDKIWEELNLKDKKVVSVHFRLTDYLLIASLNLNEDYYKEALKHFDNTYTYLIFSDDLEMAKNSKLFEGKDVVYNSKNKAGVDMYLMTKCNSNIIANSSFSLWGGLLNPNADKVVCPHDFIGKASVQNLYLNGNWYPEDWIAIDIKNE